MFPVLFKIGTFPIRTYGVMLMLGVVVAAALARRRAPRFGIEPEKIWDAALWLVIPGILGARITFIQQNWGYYQSHPSQLWTLRFEGLTSFGGLIFGFLGFLWWQWRSKTPFWRFLDTIGIPVLVAQAIGRIGCLFNGCCYGRPTSEWYGVQFADVPGKHVPAQLVDFFFMLVGALALTIWERKARPKPGVSFGLFLVAYGASRFIYEFFRAGTPQEVLEEVASSAYIKGLPITLAQLTCLILALIGVGVALYATKTYRGESQEKGESLNSVSETPAT